MRRIGLVSGLIILSTAAVAQQTQVDTQTLNRIIIQLQQQRNQAADEAVLAQARLAQAQEELAKLKAEANKPKEGDGTK